LNEKKGGFGIVNPERVNDEKNPAGFFELGVPKGRTTRKSEGFSNCKFRRKGLSEEPAGVLRMEFRDPMAPERRWFTGNFPAENFLKILLC
jgi:hypothetical protein